MASGPIILWQINGEKVEAVTDFLFLGSRITANHDCRCEPLKRESIFKKRERERKVFFKKILFNFF